MQKTKLIVLLKTFSNEEMSQFGKFISTPYFATGRNLKPLYNSLKKYHPGYSPDIIDEKKIFTNLFPAREFESKKSKHALSVLFSELYAMAEKFIRTERFFKENIWGDTLLLKELENRELLDIFDSVSAKILKNDEKAPRTSSYLMKKLLHNISQTRAGRQRNSPTVYAYNQSVMKAEESLIIFFLSQLSQLTLMREMNYHKDTKRNELIELFSSYFNYEKFSDALLKISNEENFLVQMHIYSARLDFDYNDTKSYEALKKILFERINKISAEYCWIFSHSLINCTMFQSKGNVNYYKNDYLDIYDMLMKKSIEDKNYRLLSRDLLMAKGIYNYVKICIKVNQLGRLEKFIKNYSKYFYEPIREDAILFSEGSLEFARENYRKSLTLLSKTNFIIPMLIKDTKLLKIKACYELGYYDLLYSEIDNYRHFLSSTKEITETQLKSDIHLMKFTKRLAGIKYKSDTAGLKKLESEIENLEHKTLHTQWLVKKIEELKFVQ